MSMAGWRIEVREALHNRTGWIELARPNGETHRMNVYPFILAPRLCEAINRHALRAAADPLFETIYVSRALDEREADTLRELLDAEMRREREAEKAAGTEAVKAAIDLLGIAAVQHARAACFDYSPPSAEEAARAREASDRLSSALSGLPGEHRVPIGYALEDSVPHPTLPGHHLVTIALGAPMVTPNAEEQPWYSVADFAEAISGTKLTMAQRAIANRVKAGTSPRPTRVLQVGDEIEVRNGGWHLMRIDRVCGDGWVYGRTPNSSGGQQGVHPRGEGRTWRWPAEATRAEPKPAAMGSMDVYHLDPKLKAIIDLRVGDRLEIKHERLRSQWLGAQIVARSHDGFVAYVADAKCTVERLWFENTWRPVGTL